MKDIVLVCSKKDQASMNMYSFLKQDFKESEETYDDEPILVRKGSKMILTNKELVFDNGFEKIFKPEAIFFISKHTAASKKPALTTHSIGIFNDDVSVGGEEKILGHSLPFYQSQILRDMNFLGRKDYDISFEATHHGPVIENTPSVFIEMGSEVKGWNSKSVGEFMSEVILKNLKPKSLISKKRNEVAIGFGGQHYPKKFTKLCFEEKYDFGHICPRHATKFLTKNLIKQMVEKSTPKPKIGVIDKKSCNQKGQIKNWLEEKDLEILMV